MYLNGFSVRVPEGNEKEASGYVEIDHNTQYTLQLRNQRNSRCDAEVNIDGKHVGTFRLGAYGSLRLERSADDNRRFTAYLRDSEEGHEVELDSVSKSDLGLIQVVFKPEKKPMHIKKKRKIAKNISSLKDSLPGIWFGKDRERGFSIESNDDEVPDNEYVDSFNISREDNIPQNMYQISREDNIPQNMYQIVTNSIQCFAAKGLKAVGTGMSGHSDQSFYDVPALSYDDDAITTISLRLVGRKRKTRGPLKPVQKSTPIPPPVWMI